jgi:hypothetical protein
MILLGYPLERTQRDLTILQKAFIALVYTKINTAPEEQDKDNLRARANKKYGTQ